MTREIAPLGQSRRQFESWAEEYVAKAGLSSPPLLRRLALHAVSAALPAPWVRQTDAKGRSYFVDVDSRSSSWQHPFDEVLEQLRNHFPVLVPRPGEVDRGLVQARVDELQAAYEESTLAWREAKDAEGETYFYHVETRESVWEDPRAAFEPTKVLIQCWRLLLAESAAGASLSFAAPERQPVARQPSAPAQP